MKSNRTLYKTTKTWLLVFLWNLVKRSKNQFPYFIGKLFFVRILIGFKLVFCKISFSNF